MPGFISDDVYSFEGLDPNHEKGGVLEMAARGDGLVLLFQLHPNENEVGDGVEGGDFDTGEGDAEDFGGEGGF